jgi:Uma2 family endonuclease
MLTGSASNSPSTWVPDVAVVVGGPRDYKEHPSTALLIVEIAETSLAFDQTVKARVYAKAGIGDYWIVNLVDRCVEIRRDPRKDSTGNWSYAQSAILAPNQTISPLAAPQSPILVADLLP